MFEVKVDESNFDRDRIKRVLEFGTETGLQMTVK